MLLQFERVPGIAVFCANFLTFQDFHDFFEFAECGGNYEILYYKSTYTYLYYISGMGNLKQLKVIRGPNLETKNDCGLDKKSFLLLCETH